MERDALRWRENVKHQEELREMERIKKLALEEKKKRAAAAAEKERTDALERKRAAEEKERTDGLERDRATAAALERTIAAERERVAAAELRRQDESILDSAIDDIAVQETEEDAYKFAVRHSILSNYSGKRLQIFAKLPFDKLEQAHQQYQMSIQTPQKYDKQIARFGTILNPEEDDDTIDKK